MPIYEYHCLDCKTSFNELRRIAEKDSQIECPRCACLKTKRFFSSFSVGGFVSVKNSDCFASSSKFT